MPPSTVVERAEMVLGATITTTTTITNILVAFLAIFVSLGTAHLWDLLLFGLYQSRANKTIGDGLYRQQQALLRSLPSPESAFLLFTKLGWAWWGKARAIRSFGPAGIALLFAIATFAVGIASSLVFSTTDVPVLVIGNNCGFYDGYTAGAAIQSYFETSANDALNYARSCYINQTTTASCIKYVQPRIEFSTTPVPCPFAESMCMSTPGVAKDTPAILLDTGYMDSNDVFGINARPEDRVQVRKQTTCAPIKIPGYFKTANATAYGSSIGREALPGEQLFVIEYGTIVGAVGPLADFSYSTYQSNLTESYSAVSAWSGPSYSTGDVVYHQIPELTRPDADNILVFIFSNSIISLEPINDPVFLSQKNISFITYGVGSDHRTAYAPNYPLGTVGCTEQYQFCVPSPSSDGGRKCTKWGGIPAWAGYAIPALGANEKQVATFQLLYYGMVNNDVSIAGNTVNPPPLQAQQSLEGRVQQFLPDHQWMIEVTLWDSFVLSIIQKFVTDYALGPKIKKKGGSVLTVKPLNSTAGSELCQTQKMVVAGGFANVNVFGFAITVAISGFVVLVDLCLMRILVFLNQFHGAWGNRIDRWVQDGLLQLQRKAYEGMGEGDWAALDKEIPVLSTDEMLPDFQLDHAQSASKSVRTMSFGPLSRRGTAATDNTTLVRDNKQVQATDAPIHIPQSTGAGSVTSSRGETLNDKASPLTSSDAAL